MDASISHIVLDLNGLVVKMEIPAPERYAEPPEPISDVLPASTRALGSAASRSDKLLFWWEISSAALVLAECLLEGPSLHGLRVLELGCGLGLPGIVMGLSGAHVTFTDYDPRALELARANAELNGLSNAQYHTYDWEHPLALGEFDIIMGSEIIYDYAVHSDLLRILLRHTRAGGVVLLADRKRLAISRFLGRMRSSGFSCDESTRTPMIAGFLRQEISVFRLRREGVADA